MTGTKKLIEREKQFYEDMWLQHEDARLIIETNAFLGEHRAVWRENGTERGDLYWAGLELLQLGYIKNKVVLDYACGNGG
jgi:hypothetical protein